MKLYGPHLVVLYGVICVTAETSQDKSDRKKRLENPIKTGSCEDNFSFHVQQCIEPFSRKVDQYINTKPDNLFVYQIFVKYACRKYKKMLLCVHTVLTNCPTQKSYDVVQHSLNKPWVPTINSMCNIQSNKTVNKVTKTSRKHSPKPQTTDSFPYYTLFKSREQDKSRLADGNTDQSINVITIYRKEVLPSKGLGSRVSILIPSGFTLHNEGKIPKTKNTSLKGNDLLQWLYIVISDSTMAVRHEQALPISHRGVDVQEVDSTMALQHQSSHSFSIHCNSYSCHFFVIISFMYLVFVR